MSGDWVVRGDRVDALRRRLLLAAAMMPIARNAGAVRPDAIAKPGIALRFPHDEGSHPEFRIEWWYVTGWLREEGDVDVGDVRGGGRGGDRGFQLTFFRQRHASADDNPSRFAPRQLIAVHAALSDPRRGRLVHVQRLARAAFGLAEAREDATDVRLADASLVAQGEGRLLARVAGRALSLDLALTRTQPPLLHGDHGYSRKGPGDVSASYYYTLPHLRVSGSVAVDGKAARVEGTAWLDHEWSSAPMDAAAAGWDWIGINLDDGGALMAFRMRDRAGQTLWSAGTLRDAAGNVRTFDAADVRWTALRSWRSPRTGATYPVAWRVIAGDRSIDLEPLMDDQEQDGRLTTGAIYWEGAVTARIGARRIGRGYLEMTGYAGLFRL